MAADIVLKIDGVEGDSLVQEHEGEIDVLSCSWAATNASSSHYGGGAGVAKVTVGDLSVMKRVDKASPDLLLKTCMGEHYPTAELTFRKSGGKAPVDYMKYKMSKVYVTSWQESGGGDQFASETVSFSFEKVKVTFTGQNDDGTPKEPVEVEWDIAKNAKP